MEWKGAKEWSQSKSGKEGKGEPRRISHRKDQIGKGREVKS